VEEIIVLAAEAGLLGIEWGGDRQVLPGHLGHAKQAGQLTRATGLEAVSYGSYYFAFDQPGDPLRLKLLFPSVSFSSLFRHRQVFRQLRSPAPLPSGRGNTG
jgi:hypothetical protein